MAVQILDQTTIDRVIELVGRLPTPAFIGLVESTLQAHQGGDAAQTAAVDELGTDLRYMGGKLQEGVGAIRKWWQGEDVPHSYIAALEPGWPDGPGYAELGASPESPDAVRNGVQMLYTQLNGPESRGGVLGELNAVLAGYNRPGVEDAIIAFSHVSKGALDAHGRLKQLPPTSAPATPTAQPPPAPAGSQAGRIADALSGGQPQTPGSPSTGPIRPHTSRTRRPGTIGP